MNAKTPRHRPIAKQQGSLSADRKDVPRLPQTLLREGELSCEPSWGYPSRRKCVCTVGSPLPSCGSCDGARTFKSHPEGQHVLPKAAEGLREMSWGEFSGGAEWESFSGEGSPWGKPSQRAWEPEQRLRRSSYEQVAGVQGGARACQADVQQNPISRSTDPRLLGVRPRCHMGRPYSRRAHTWFNALMLPP